MKIQRFSLIVYEIKALLQTPQRILISKNSLAIFTSYPSVTKHQALEETFFRHLIPPALWFMAALKSVVLLLRIQSPITMLSKVNSQK